MAQLWTKLTQVQNSVDNHNGRRRLPILHGLATAHPLTKYTLFLKRAAGLHLYQRYCVPLSILHRRSGNESYCAVGIQNCMQSSRGSTRCLVSTTMASVWRMPASRACHPTPDGWPATNDRITVTSWRPFDRGDICRWRRRLLMMDGYWSGLTWGLAVFHPCHLFITPGMGYLPLQNLAGQRSRSRRTVLRRLQVQRRGK